MAPEYDRAATGSLVAAEMLCEVLRMAKGLDEEEFERDVLPRLRRLTADQRWEVLETMRATAEDAKQSGDWRQPAA